MGEFNLKKYSIVLLLFFIPFTVVGLKSNVFAHQCNGFDTKQESSSINQSDIDDHHIKNTNDQSYCKISNAKNQDNFYHLQKSTELSFARVTNNSGKAEYLSGRIFSSFGSKKAGYSPIPILFQKESFQI
ncbi:MAG TPA: hypothetical protein ENI15_09315 [Spirochaetes bacterium]|nr:hypothetical protein [Spirochaetota bacterium]